jgi:TonB family protein
MIENGKQFEGQVVNGEFSLQRYLGGSDHSAVFLTERTGSEPGKAAIKLIPANPETADLQFGRWTQAAKLSHPHLLRVFEVGRCELNGVPLLYIVMECAEEDLSQILPQRPLTPAEAQDMLLPILDALSYLHSHGLVHGHLKPSNIMAAGDQLKLSSDGLYSVEDSNSAALLHAGEEPTAYDAPETANGAISPAADVWSLGVTLLEALMLCRPVFNETDVPNQDATEAVDPVLPEGVPQPFIEITRRCLRSDPQRRWTVTAMAAWLRSNSGASPTPAVLQPSKSESTKPGPTPESKTSATEPRKLSGPRKASPAWLYAILAVAVALAVFAGLRLRGSHPQAQIAPAENEKTEAQPPEVQQTPATAAAESKSEAAPRSPAQPPSSAPETSRVRTELRSTRYTGAVLHQVLPNVPQSAVNTIQGKVKVSVKVVVDASGNVVEATLDSPGPSRYFARLALQAAQEWKFAPPQADGKVPSKWILHFVFSRTGAEVLPPQPAS